MKTIFFVLFFSITNLTFSQNANKEDHAVKHTEYCCVKKDYCGEKAKKCPNDKMPLIKNGFYYCSKCYKSKKKPGECGKCDVPLIKMEN